MLTRAERLSAAGVAKFTAAVGLAAIFVDAAIGHGLTWENDPYWTYWVTKTFLIATIFGLGTAWFGIGPGRGAVITAVHTLVLTVYYWTLSPVGLPSTPSWLDLEHTWITGLPIHFGVIYAGYLLTLWAWRWREEVRDARPLDAGPVALLAFLFGIGIVVVAGGLSVLALGEFPGFTWFLVRLLITVPYLLVWWGLFGTDLASNVVGAVVLAFVWATYSQFLGPVGLPDTPLRILNPAPPPATVRWLDYKELWLISLPIYLIVMLGAMVLMTRREGREARRPLAAAALLPVILLTAGFTIDPEDRGVSASFSASGDVEIEGEGSGTGEISISATDMGNRVTPLPPHDRLSVRAAINGTRTYDLSVRLPMVEDPLGRESTWWGVAFGVDYREPDGENVTADLVAYGLGDLTVDGEVVGRGLPVEILASREAEYPMTLEVGNVVTPIPGEVPELSATWSSYGGVAPEGASLAHYIGGVVVLVILLALGLLLTRSTGFPSRTHSPTGSRAVT
jgi:hypothetical protein